MYCPWCVQPDIHQGAEVAGNHSQDDREKGDWEESRKEDEEGAQSPNSGSESAV